MIPESTAAQRADTTTLAAQPATGNPGGQPAARKDTASTVKPATATNPATPAFAQHTPVPEAGQSLWRFVILQTPNKNHALRRYNQLLGYQLNIHMEQKDSSLFKLYFPIAAAIKDTTHIKDSLANVYAAHVSIDQ